MTPQEFIDRWKGRTLSERAAAQSHFNDLCELLGVPAPTDERETDSSYGFEARTDLSAAGLYPTREVDGMPLYRIETSRTRSSGGFADVWKRDHFAWEYKRAGKHPTLESALAQLRIYAASLGNPPLLIVCDIDRYEIHTNFTNYPTEVFTFTIEELANPSPEWRARHPTVSPIQALRKIFDDPVWFRPTKTREAITAEYARIIGELAKALRDGGNDPHAVAHFLMQVVFCFFAEDIGLLPRSIFTDLIDKSQRDPANFPAKTRNLFKAMEHGGVFGDDTIEWFNGGLYKDVDADPIINLAPAWLGQLLMVARKDWNGVDPTIFGTLFERSLDPDKRSQIGAHYTSREDILLIVEPVIMQPLRRKWIGIQKTVAEWADQRTQPDRTPRQKANLTKKINSEIEAFCDELAKVTVLDPACGSGNFLFVTIRQLLDLEQEVHAFAARDEIRLHLIPRVQPKQLRGIDVNDYACELARVSIWIGYLQWLHANSGGTQRRPILDPLDTIEHRDAILKWEKDSEPIEIYEEGAECTGPAEWPKADFIVGNPPFLGGVLLRQSGLADDYVDAMQEHYAIPNGSDLCCYWFEQGRKAIKRSWVERVGLLATQGIRGRENRTVLERIKDDGDIFMAWSDRVWVLEGAMVHVSMIGFDDGTEASRTLDGAPVQQIHATLSGNLDVGTALTLGENAGIYRRAPEKGGKFDIDFETARSLLASGPNPNGRANLEVLCRWINGGTLVNGHPSEWIIDFDGLEEHEAAQYEAPFNYVERHVRAARRTNRYQSLRDRWWLHRRPGDGIREAARELPRMLATTMVAKYRLFAWIDTEIQPDKTIVPFARDDDYWFGVLHSSIHEVWARRTGTQLREAESGFRYTPTTCFETFPLPWPPGEEPEADPHYIAIAEAAKNLDELRENWLNPPEWIKPIEDAVDRFENFDDVPEEAVPHLRQSAIMARAAKDARLKKRTLTNLYNERPWWLKLAHRKLDEAVIAAYVHIDESPVHDWDTEWARAYEPFGAGEITIVDRGSRPDSEEVIAAKQAAIELRAEVDEKILANLLRLNQERAAANT